MTAIADVRSAPYSRRNPQFNKEPLKQALHEAGTVYSPMGDVLGGRPENPALWRGPRPDYERIATSPSFCEGLGRIATGAQDYRIALMCAEKEPLDCHRCLLVARALKERGEPVHHILSDGTIEDHAATEARLLAWAKISSTDMFDQSTARLADAYRKRAGWIWGERPLLGPR